MKGRIKMKRYICLLLFVLTSLLLCAQPVAEVRIAENFQYDGHVLKSSANETWVLWDDSIQYGYEIHGQKYDGLGSATFDSPITIATSETSVKLLDAVPSTDNGLIILFMQEEEDSDRQAFLKVQKLSSQGQPQWTASGIYVAPVVDLKFVAPRLCANNLGGAFLFHASSSTEGVTFTKCLNYDAAGSNIWTTDNVINTDGWYGLNQLLLTDAGDLIINFHGQSGYPKKVDNSGNTVGSYPMFAPDAVVPEDIQFQKGTNGNILLYSANYQGDNTLKMQMMDANGSLLYSTLKDLPMPLAYGYSTILKIAALSDGGFSLAYVSETHLQGRPNDLRVQRLSPALEPVWGSEPPMTLTGDCSIKESYLAVDASDNTWLSVLRFLPGNERDMLVEMVKLNPDGNPVFAPQMVGSTTGIKRFPIYALLSDKAMLVWSDYLSGVDSIRRQIFTATGDPLLSETGAPIVSKLSGTADSYGVYSLADRTVCLMLDSRGKKKQIYYQILDNEMNQYMPANGQALDTSDDWAQSILATKLSPQNTLFIVYRKQGYTVHRTYLQELDRDGNLLYPGSGILLSNMHSGAALAFADDSCYIYWIHSLDNHNSRRIIKGQRIMAGACVWEEGGIEIYSNPSKTVNYIDATGKYLVFKCYDLNSRQTDLMALYIQASGAIDPAWDPMGEYLFYPKTWLRAHGAFRAGIIQDDLYCLYEATNQSQEQSLIAQKMNPAGRIQWSNLGLQICQIADAEPSMLTSIFSDQISLLYQCGTQDFLLQEIDTAGNMGFEAYGIAMPASDIYGTNVQLSKHSNGSYSYFWLDGNSPSGYKLKHIYISPNGSFTESQTLFAAKIDDIRAVNCDHSAIVYWSQSNSDFLSWYGSGTGGLYAKAVAEPSSSADIASEPMPMLSLSQNSPNPFTGSTRISYKLRDSSPVKIQIFNIKGQLVHELPQIHKAAGEHSWDWDGNDARDQKCAAGIYLYKVHSGRYSASRKMILLR